MSELIERLQGHVETLLGVASGVYSDDIQEAIAEIQQLREVVESCREWWRAPMGPENQAAAERLEKAFEQLQKGDKSHD